MSDGQPILTDPGSIGRRRFLKVTGGAVAGSSLLTMLDAHQAPAQLKGTTLRILTWSHFIPAYDVWFDKFSADWGEKNGVKVRVDHIPHLEIPARMAAEFAAGAGHDIINNNSTILARLYYKSLLDLTDVFDGLGKKYGGWIPAAKSPIEVEGKIYGIPQYYILLPMLWRKDLFEANGLKPPDTWELARVAARTLKPKGNPAGIAFSHCNDANLVWRSLMFSFGATETDASDNRFLASGIAGWIHDAISAYRTTESTNPPVFKNTYVGLEPAGPSGKRVHCVAPIVFLSWKFSKNPQAVKEYLAALGDADKDGMIASTGYNMPFLNDNAKKPMPILGADPKLQVLQDFPKIVAFFGYPGPYTPQIQEVGLLFVLPDIFTRVARGQSIDDSLKWGVGEYRRIFAKHKKA